jgi:hypothetical protein
VRVEEGQHVQDKGPAVGAVYANYVQLLERKHHSFADTSLGVTTPTHPTTIRQVLVSYHNAIDYIRKRKNFAYSRTLLPNPQFEI